MIDASVAPAPGRTPTTNPMRLARGRVHRHAHQSARLGSKPRIGAA